MQKIMTEKERMLSEKLYIPMDEALAADCARSRRLVRLINGTTEEQAEYRVQLLRNCLAGQGKIYGWSRLFTATTAAIFL